jgi:hypothetical protein
MARRAAGRQRGVSGRENRAALTASAIKIEAAPMNSPIDPVIRAYLSSNMTISLL